MGKSDSLAVNEVSERDMVLLNCYLCGFGNFSVNFQFSLTVEGGLLQFTDQKPILMVHGMISRVLMFHKLKTDKGCFLNTIVDNF